MRGKGGLSKIDKLGRGGGGQKCHFCPDILNACHYGRECILDGQEWVWWPGHSWPLGMPTSFMTGLKSFPTKAKVTSSNASGFPSLTYPKVFRAFPSKWIPYIWNWVYTTHSSGFRICPIPAKLLKLDSCRGPSRKDVSGLGKGGQSKGYKVSNLYCSVAEFRH